jgi:hypothetical protein
MGRIRFAFVMAMLAATALAPAASAEVPPPTLTGETFLGGLFAPPGTSTVIVTSASCDPSGTSTFTYQVTGPAAGPYVGTYAETAPNGLVTSWTASFTITGSPLGTVSGTKTLPPNAPTLPGVCKGFDVLHPAERSAATGQQNALSYTATITVPGGAQYSDQGGSEASVAEFPDIPSFNQFFEDFTSSQATTTPICNQNDQTNQNQNLNNQGCKNP